MFRFAFIAPVAASLVFLAACGIGDEPAPTAPATVSSTPHNDPTIAPVTPIPRPASVPEAARFVGQTTTLGRIIRAADQPPRAVAVRGLLTATCQEDILLIQTSQEAIYAELPCTRFWDPATAASFTGQPAAIVLEVTQERFRILIETLAGAQAEFTVNGIWVE